MRLLLLMLLPAGGGATEAADTAGPSPEAQATVTKRLLLGGAATLGLLAFAMVPTKELRLKPQKPLYFYVVQLLSAQVGSQGLHDASYVGVGV
jgi:hypothetical protein